MIKYIKDIYNRNDVLDIIDAYGDLFDMGIRIVNTNGRVYAQNSRYDADCLYSAERPLMLTRTESVKVYFKSSKELLDNVMDMIILVLEKLAVAGLEKQKKQEKLERLNNRQSLLKKNNEVFKKLAERDSLTGLYNHRAFEKEMQRLSNMKDKSICVISGDADNLKLMNDLFGHEAGDRMLIAIANKMKDIAQDCWVVARCGGDEFCAILPDYSLKMANAYCERVIQKCKNDKELNLPLSIALGAAQWNPDTETLNDCFKRADEIMYSNKKNQKNREDLLEYILEQLYERGYLIEEVVEKNIDVGADFANYLGLAQSKIDKIKLTAKYQDLGYIQFPEHFLVRGVNMTPEEREIISHHVVSGYEIALKFEKIHNIADIILRTHENWSGNGYPDRLCGSNIPVEARLVHIVDNFNYWTTAKEVGTCMSVADAVARLRKYSKEMYDPEMVEKFIEYLKLKKIYIDKEDNEKQE